MARIDGARADDAAGLARRRNAEVPIDDSMVTLLSVLYESLVVLGG